MTNATLRDRQRHVRPGRQLGLAAALLAALLAGGSARAADRGDEPCCGTKTPYRAPAPAEAAVTPWPPGYQAVHTQIVTRHGARGLTRPGADVAWIALLRRAQQEGALRAPAGPALLAELERFVALQARLGQGRPEIEQPGYGALTRLGIDEQRGLAERMAARVAPLLDAPGVRIDVLLSGVDRAEQSALSFIGGLQARTPTLAPDLAAARSAMRADRYTLYFHKLTPQRDGAGAAGSGERQEVLRRSQAYQRYLESDALQARLRRFAERPDLASAARSVLLGPLQPGLVERLERRELVLGPQVELAVPGRAAPLVAEPKLLAKPAAVLDWAQGLYELAIIAPLFERDEGAPFDFARYVSPQAMRLLAELDDHESFYEKGPATSNDRPVTYAMAGALLADMLVQAEMAAAGGRAAARLRFAHAEIVLPLALLLDLPGAYQPLPPERDFAWASHRWRSAAWIPMSSNIQWDTAVHAESGRALVRMLFNEREQPFASPACDGARLAPASRLYDLERLRACLGPLLPQ